MPIAVSKPVMPVMTPFGSHSGASIKTMPHVSHLPNKKIKVLLTQAAHQA
jgi:hypothetical protein